MVPFGPQSKVNWLMGLVVLLCIPHLRSSWLFMYVGPCHLILKYTGEVVLLNGDIRTQYFEIALNQIPCLLICMNSDVLIRSRPCGCKLSSQLCCNSSAKWSQRNVFNTDEKHPDHELTHHYMSCLDFTVLCQRSVYCVNISLWNTGVAHYWSFSYMLIIVSRDEICW